MHETIAKLIAPEWWTPKDADGEDRPISLRIRALNGLEYCEAMSMVGRGDDGRWVMDIPGLRYLLRTALLDWKQPSDAEVPLPDFSIENAWQCLDAALLPEIAGQIMTKSAMTDEKKRTCTSPARSSKTPNGSTATSVSGDDSATDETPPQ